MDYNEVTLVDLSKSLLGGKEAKAAALAAKRAGEKYAAAGKRADRWTRSNLTSQHLTRANPGKWDADPKMAAKMMGDIRRTKKMADASTEVGRATIRYRNALTASQKAAASHDNRTRAAIGGALGGAAALGGALGVSANRKYEVKNKKRD